MAGVLRSVALDTMTAIYDRRSGQTHLVAAIVPAILDAIGDQGAALVSLAERLEVADGIEVLAERVDELVTIGLVDAR